METGAPGKPRGTKRWSRSDATVFPVPQARNMPRLLLRLVGALIVGLLAAGVVDAGLRGEHAATQRRRAHGARTQGLVTGRSHVPVAQPGKRMTGRPSQRPAVSRSAAFRPMGRRTLPSLVPSSSPADPATRESGAINIGGEATAVREATQAVREFGQP